MDTLTDQANTVPRPPDGAPGAAPAGVGQPRRWFRHPLWLGILVFVVAATVRILHYAEVRHSPFHDGKISMLDANYYDLLARRIASGVGLSNDVYFMAPLYPYVLSVPYRFFVGPRSWAPGQPIVYGPEIHAAAYVQCVWGALTCALIFELGRRLAGRAAGVIAGLAAALYGMFIFQDGLLMATQLITFVNVVAMLVLLRAARGGGVGWWAAGGIMLGICAIAHGTAVLLIPGVVLWIVVGVPALTRRRRLTRVVAVCAGAAVCIGAVTVRNYVVGHDLVLLTSNSGLTFFIGNNAAATGSFAAVPDDVANTPGASLTWYMQGQTLGPSDPRQSETSRALRERAFAFIRANPGQWLGLLARKFGLFWNAVEVGSGDQYYFYQRFSHVLRGPVVTYGILVPVGLTGLICTLARWRTFLLLYVWLAVQTVAYTLSFVLARYRLVAVTCLMVLAAAQIVWWITELRARRLRNVGLSLLALAAFALAVHYPMAGFTPQRGWGEQYRILAVSYAGAGQDQAAIDCLEQALQFDFAPRDENTVRLVCLSSLVQLYGRQGRLADVVAAAERALQLLETMPPTLENRVQRHTFEEIIRRAGGAAASRPAAPR